MQTEIQRKLDSFRYMDRPKGDSITSVPSCSAQVGEQVVEGTEKRVWKRLLLLWSFESFLFPRPHFPRNFAATT
jgi:hypothetical protein